MYNYRILWSHIKSTHKRLLVILLFLMLLTSLLEMLSVGAILPFIGVIINPEQIFVNKYLQPIISQLGFTSPNQIILPITVFFITASLFAAVTRITLLYLQNFVTQKIGSEISIEVYKRTLYQDYLIHTSRNTSEVVSGIIQKTYMVSEQIILQILTLIGSVFIIIGLVSLLVFINIQVALILFLTIGGMYLLIMQLSIKQLEKNSIIIAKGNVSMIKILQEGLLGFREVLLNRAQSFYSKIFAQYDWPIRKAHASSAILSGLPKFVIEAIGMTLVAILAYLMTYQNDNPLGAIPVLAAFAIGAQRILPALQQVFSAYASIKSAKESFVDVIVLLEQPYPNYMNNDSSDKIIFSNKIELRNVSFKYPGQSSFILEDINLVVNKGDSIGVIGETGSGKSTLIDIIMGMLPPSSGILLVDGKEINHDNRHLWWQLIASVPQNINLFDTTVEQNIAFGVLVEAIDHERVLKSAKDAKVSNLIEGWDKKYQALIGEHGVRISGGQRQRIGIARALYQNSEVLVLDEATSALDNKTEENVIQSINTSVVGITIIMIAHRVTTLKQCNKIFKLTNEVGVTELKYDDINK